MAAAASFGGVSAAAVAAPTDDSNPLVEFNKKFRAAVEEKDAKEREAKNARRSTGKATLKKLLSERLAKAEARKTKNRDDEAQKEREMLDALQSESWSRVVSLIDIHGSAAGSSASSSGGASSGAGAAAHSAEHKDKKHSKEAHAHGDTSRMKDVLIQLKAKPL